MITRGRVVIGAVIAALMLILIGAVVLAPRTSDEPLDPTSAGGSGARAVAQVLGQHGVKVSVVRRATQLQGEDVRGATVVLTRPDLLSPQSLETMEAAVAGARRLVIVDADPATVEALVLPIARMKPVTGEPDPACSISWLSGLRMSNADVSYTVAGSAPDCYGGALAVLPKRGRDPQIVLLGSRAVLANGTITNADNAAIALRTLGASDHLVWFAPTIATADNAAASGPKWPGWFHPGIWLAAFAVVAVMVWRGRRFGRLAAEPLPVVVPADETTRSRGQLYRKARDTSRSAAVLRLATRGRLARYLGLAPNGDRQMLVDRTAHAAQDDPRQIGDLLFGGDPPDEASMTKLAQDLDQLERQVRQ